MPEQRFQPTIVVIPDESGPFIRYQHCAAGPVTPGTTPPEREGLPLLCRYPHGTFMLTYIGGRFKHTNGSQWAAPIEWAYITWTPDIDLSIYEPRPQRPESTGQWLYDTMRIIAKHHKFRDVQDVMDVTPWPNDVEGEPEPSAGGTQP